MKLEYGCVDLSGLYDFAKTVDLFRKSKSRESYRKYRVCYQHLIKDVQKIPGWYVWYDSNSGKVIYIGCTGDSLHNRLKETLRNEYVIFWMEKKKNSKKVADLKALYKEKYNANIERAAKKYGANRIFWIGGKGITDGERDIVEMKLINKFDHKELANDDRRDYSKIELALFDEVEEIVESHLQASECHEAQ